ncbi:MAG: asparagine synthase-related protein [Streptosporangiaceae bacterium]
MYFTLAVSAPDPAACADLVQRACGTDPRVMPIPGPARVVWRAESGCAALTRWGDGPVAPGGTPGSPPPVPRTPGEPPGVSGYPPAGAASFAGTIWVSDEAGGTVHARTSITRVDPVFVAQAGRSAIIADRATWAAAVAGRLGDADPLLYAGLLGPGYPLGPVTPFTGVRALGPATACRAIAGQVKEAAGQVTEKERARLREHATAAGRPGAGGPGPGDSGAGDPGSLVAAALVAAITPLRDASVPVELSLTGGKDSRLIAAALATAGVPVRARTYGFPDHPDVVLAAQVARELGLPHEVAGPRMAGDGDAPAVQEVDVLARLRATVLVADGMLSAFENVGRPDPDPAAAAIAIGGHGGELLRGGYAKLIPGSAARRAAGSAELLRRLTLRRIPLLRARWRTAYVAGLAPWGAAVAARPQPALDDFYLVNRAGRWSAAARQAYAIRAVMAQPFFDGEVVRAARTAPLAERLDDRLIRAATGALCPALLDIPLAGDRWKSGPALPPAPAGPAAPSQRSRFDWRRGYGDEVARFLQAYVLDTGSGADLFAIVSRPAAERLLRPPHSDPVTVWALATLAALISQDWLSARAADGQTFAIPVPA